MEILRVTSKELSSYTDAKRKPTKHGKHRKGYFVSERWRKYNRKKQAEYRAKKRTFKQPTPFQQLKLKQLLKLLVSHRSFVPVAPKLKHPTTKNWNAKNYWYKSKLDLNNLERGCVRIYEDNWNGCYIGWLDIDCKKWTKIAKKYRCGYVKSPKGHIRIPFLFKNKNQEKTGTLYFQNQKIGDAKLTGEVMLPSNAYYDKNGKFLGYYEYKAWGTFFPLRNYVFENPSEFFEILKQDFGIEYKTIREHFYKQKLITKIGYTPPETLFTSAREPPWQKMIITPNSFRK